MDNKEVHELTATEAAIAIALPLGLISLSESLNALVIQRWFPSNFRSLFMLVHGHWLMVISVAIACFAVSRYSRQGPLACAAGLALAFYALFHFRGSREWQGTFTTFDRDARPWEFDLLLAYAGGTSLGLWAAKRFGRSTGFARVGVIFVLIGTGWAVADSISLRTTSEFAPTRQFVDLAMVTVIFASWMCETLFASARYEEGLHSR